MALDNIGHQQKKSQFTTTGIQANFETYTIDSNEKRNKIKNGHLNIR
ncbi:hypothetical protein NLA_2030 [Neisseria lactamica 020-06]|uniref:Uncharacterized protein n=1 Tax=Neisseria lactamica (strain 020-06) TaxID=489653 RepID=E4ZAI2_NEIL0|nr:hypothetical protein NLA_2030 [Neisseria lactamica 020-06]